jgi:hypothetical protein
MKWRHLSLIKQYMKMASKSNQQNKIITQQKAFKTSSIWTQWILRPVVHWNCIRLSKSSPVYGRIRRLIPWYVKALLCVYYTRRTRPNATEHGQVMDGSHSNVISRTYSYVSLIHENMPLWDMQDKQYHHCDVQIKLVDPCTIGSTSFSALSDVIRLQWTRLNIGRPGRP